MLRLSVNVNKVATLRNSRGGDVPHLLSAVQVIVDQGCPGITVHPRHDERHIRRRDVYEIAEWIGQCKRAVEYNIEGDPQPDWLDMVCELRPTQATLVPVKPGEITSSAGWSCDESPTRLRDIVQRLQAHNIRVSVFVDPHEKAVEWAAKTGANRVELYTEPYARAFATSGAQAAVLAPYAHAAAFAHSLGLGVNAGHDLDLDNLGFFATIPHLLEVSIGHALLSRALFVGLDRVVAEYLAVIDSANRRVESQA